MAGARPLGHEQRQVLADFDKVFAMLDGKNIAEAPLTQLFDSQLGELRQGKRLGCSYFEVRFFPGVGTIHFFPRSKVLIDRLNRFVGQRRAWLPPASSTVDEGLWQAYEAAEKLDTQVRKEFAHVHRVHCAQNPRLGYQLRTDPLRVVFADGEDNEAVRAMLLDSVESVLADAGLLAALEGTDAPAKPLLGYTAA
jgi:hypothetical protein